MLCYRDMTFCSAAERCGTPNCDRRFTAEEEAQARAWWGSESNGPPVAFADFSGRPCFTEATQEKGE